MHSGQFLLYAVFCISQPHISAQTNNTVTVENGRCTDALVGSGTNASTAFKDVVCNTFEAQAKCISDSLCMWRNDRRKIGCNFHAHLAEHLTNDSVYSCFCTFVACSCGSASQGATQSTIVASRTLVLVIIPVFITAFMVRCSICH